ncbi:hypothetical protein [Streptomyces sp. NPDC056194]|uniref:hypothetical protein n=1 Tax=Streptomyces sp. NPDC056194 TaxID=3345744 RepID=UPI0035E0AA68
MSSAEQEVTRQFAKLQQRVGDRRAQVLSASSDKDALESGYAELLRAVDELVEFDKTVPARLAEPARLLSEQIVRWSWGVQAAVAAVLIVLVFILDLSGGWLVVLVPHLLATLSGYFQKVSSDDHMTRRFATIALHAAGLLVALVTLGVISLWFLVLVLVIWVPLFGTFADDSTMQKGAGR